MPAFATDTEKQGNLFAIHFIYCIIQSTSIDYDASTQWRDVIELRPGPGETTTTPILEIIYKRYVVETSPRRSFLRLSLILPLLKKLDLTAVFRFAHNALQEVLREGDCRFQRQCLAFRRRQ